MAEISLRSAAPPDAEAIATVQVTTWQHAYRGLLSNEFLKALSIQERAEHWRIRLSQLTADRAVWVADVNDHVVAFCSVGPSQDDDAGAATGEVYALYVEPRFMGQGIGAALMKAGNRTLQEYGCLHATLWVLVGNAPARRFYERQGWEPDGAMKTENRNNASFHVMRYRIRY